MWHKSISLLLRPDDQYAWHFLYLKLTLLRGHSQNPLGVCIFKVHGCVHKRTTTQASQPASKYTRKKGKRQKIHNFNTWQTQLKSSLIFKNYYFSTALFTWIQAWNIHLTRVFWPLFSALWYFISFDLFNIVEYFVPPRMQFEMHSFYVS